MGIALERTIQNALEVGVNAAVGSCDDVFELGGSGAATEVLFQSTSLIVEPLGDG